MDVLVAIDGSDNSMRALSFAAEFARRYDGDLHAIHVSDDQTAATDEVFERAREAIAENSDVDADFELRTADQRTVRTDQTVAEELLAYASEHGVDHIVIGNHGTGPIERAILGSASETVVRGTTVPVTVVP